MEDREAARMRKYGEIKRTRILMATVPHVISGLGLKNFRSMDFCWHECTTHFIILQHSEALIKHIQKPVQL